MFGCLNLTNLHHKDGRSENTPMNHFLLKVICKVFWNNDLWRPFTRGRFKMQWQITCFVFKFGGICWRFWALSVTDYHDHNRPIRGKNRLDHVGYFSHDHFGLVWEQAAAISFFITRRAGHMSHNGIVLSAVTLHWLQENLANVPWVNK